MNQLLVLFIFFTICTIVQCNQDSNLYFFYQSSSTNYTYYQLSLVGDIEIQAPLKSPSILPISILDSTENTLIVFGSIVNVFGFQVSTFSKSTGQELASWDKVFFTGNFAFGVGSLSYDPQSNQIFTCGIGGDNWQNVTFFYVNMTIGGDVQEEPYDQLYQDFYPRGTYNVMTGQYIILYAYNGEIFYIIRDVVSGLSSQSISINTPFSATQYFISDNENGFFLIDISQNQTSLVLYTFDLENGDVKPIFSTPNYPGPIPEELSNRFVVSADGEYLAFFTIPNPSVNQTAITIFSTQSFTTISTSLVDNFLDSDSFIAYFD